MKHVKYVPMALLLLFSLKALCFGITWELAPVLLILGSVVCLFEFKTDKVELKQLNEKIEENKKTINTLNEKMNELTTAISTIKLASGFRTQNGR